MRDRAAVDGHERLGRARALFVNEACDQFLAGPGFATDIDRSLAARDLHDRGVELLNGVRAADQLPGGRGLARFTDFDCLGDQAAQIVDVHRLVDEIESTRLQGVDCGFHIAVGGDHRDRQLGMMLRNVRDEIEPVAIGQAHVG